MRFLVVFESPTIGVGESLAVKRKSPHFVEGYNTIPTNTKTLSGEAGLFPRSLIALRVKTCHRQLLTYAG
ncbi:MAG: hypothetical protein SPL08_04885, partial [Pseudomonadota bacterium]|nr:hypothetical protein [Pseudomonadota bacterium]